MNQKIVHYDLNLEVSNLDHFYDLMVALGTGSQDRSPWIPQSNLGYTYLSKNCPQWLAWNVHAWSWSGKAEAPDFRAAFALDKHYISPRPSQPRATKPLLTNVRASMFTSLKYAKNWVGKENSEKYWKEWKRGWADKVSSCCSYYHFKSQLKIIKIQIITSHICFHICHLKYISGKHHNLLEKEKRDCVFVVIQKYILYWRTSGWMNFYFIVTPQTFPLSLENLWLLGMQIKYLFCSWVTS